MKPLSISGRLLSGAALLCVMIGCGGASNPNAPANVKGKVTYKGTLVTAGTVTFHKDGTYPVAIKPDGTFHGTDLPDGEVVVTVETESAKAKDKLYHGKKMPLGPTPQGVNAGQQGEYVQIPAKYATPKSSPLKLTITKGEQTKDLELTD